MSEFANALYPHRPMSTIATGAYAVPDVPGNSSRCGGVAHPCTNIGSNNHELFGRPVVPGSAHAGTASTPDRSSVRNRVTAVPFAFVGLMIGNSFRPVVSFAFTNARNRNCSTANALKSYPRTNCN